MNTNPNKKQNYQIAIQRNSKKRAILAVTLAVVAAML
jgi:hypothetical protein